MKRNIFYLTCAVILALATLWGCQKGSSLITPLDEEETLTNAATDRDRIGTLPPDGTLCAEGSAIGNGTVYRNNGNGTFSPLNFVTQVINTAPVGAIIMTGSGTCSKWSRFYDNDPNDGAAEFLRNNPTRKGIMLYGLERHASNGPSPLPVFDHSICEEIPKQYLTQSSTLPQYWQKWTSTRSWVHTFNDPAPSNLTTYIDYGDNVAYANNRWPADIGVVIQCGDTKKIMWLGTPTCETYQRIGDVYSQLGLYYN